MRYALLALLIPALLLAAVVVAAGALLQVAADALGAVGL